MRRLASLIEFVLLLLLALLLAQLRWQTFSCLIDDALRQHGLSLRWHFRSLNELELYNIRYQHHQIAQRAIIHYRLLPLLHKRVIFTKILIEELDIASLAALKLPKSTPKSNIQFTWRIDKLLASAYYQNYRFKLKAGSITQKSAKIEQLLATSPRYGKAIAHGRFVQDRLYLQGIATLRQIVPKLHCKPIAFTTQIGKEGIAFSLRAKEVRYEELLAPQIEAKGFYDYKKLQAAIKAPLTWRNFQAALHVALAYEKKLTYSFDGMLTHPAIDLPLSPKAYKEIAIAGSGNLQKLETNLTTPIYQAHICLEDFKKFHLTTSPLAFYDLNRTLPQDGYLTLQAHGTFQEITLQADSNYFTLQAFKNKKETKGKLRFLRPYKDIALPALNPVHFLASSNKIHIQSALGVVDLRNDYTGSITLANAKVHIKKEGPTLIAQATISSLAKFLQAIKQLYPLTLPPIDAKVQTRGSFDTASKKFALHLQARGIKGKKLNPFEFFQTDLHGTPQKIIINYYSLVYNHHGFFATRPSTIKIGEKIFIEPFWFEDSLQIRGWLDPKTMDASFTVAGDDYTYSSIEGELTGKIGLTATLKRGNIAIAGEILLKNGLITYKPKKSHSIEDRDIIIVDKEKREHPFFLDHIALDIHIASKNPIIYKIPDIFILFRPDITLYKELQKPLQLLGVVKIVRGSYRLSGGDLAILPSSISFYGAPTNPLLEIYARTRRDRYTIFINIMGEVENPLVHFESDPPLPQNRILSLLAFGSGSQKAISKLLGGSRLGALLSNLFIKDLLENFGVKLDTLSLITQGDRLGFEIGKRINDKITILYKNDEISTLIIRYRFSDHFETEAIFGPSRSGIHIYYQNSK